MAVYISQNFKHWHFDKHFYLVLFQIHILECFNFSIGSFNIKMNKNRVRYETGINFLQLTITKKTKIKNLCNATPVLVISQSSLNIK